MTTLANFSVPIPLCCYHCSRILPAKSKAELNGNHVVVECPKCGLMTPFKVEKAS